jgi:acetylornithine aminotransferase/acetylornithine/N-succinyldiaminopimelate aminotransferase
MRSMKNSLHASPGAQRKARAAKLAAAPALIHADSRVSDADKFLLPTYKRQPIVFTHGRGAYVYDAGGKKYLDFLGGIAVNGLGHAHPRIVKVIRRQAARAIHFSNLFHNAYQGPLARKLAQWSGLSRVFFANSGTEAIDGALKLARLFGRGPGQPAAAVAAKHRILALENSFHGRTFGAISVTATEKYRLPFAPVVPGVEFVKFNDVASLEAQFDGTVCAVILETIQGEGGIHPVNEAFWNRARALTAQHGALLIADEIQCGLGRTGRYFAYQKFASKPDIALVAKPLAAGLPLGAILASEAVAARISPGVHGTTFGGGPLICATALEFLNIVEDARLLANIRERGAELHQGLAALAKRFPVITEVRGEGLMLGLQLSIEGAPLVAAALERGLLINCTHDFTIRLLPPFIITGAQVRDFLRIFESILAETAKMSAFSEAAGVAPTSQHAHAAAR